MKFPLSKLLTDILILPFSAIAAVPIIDIYNNGNKRFDQNISFLIIFGIPALILGWALIDKRTKFREVKKVSSTERLFRLPFNSFKCLFIFTISSFAMVGGLATIISERNFSQGPAMLALGTAAFVLTAVAYDHPKIWFSDSSNLEEDIERIKNTPKENFPSYQDGVFSYTDNGFTIKLDKGIRSVSWDEITLIRAYKVDQYTVDSIVIEIHLAETFISINDDTAGHMKFMDNAADKLPNFKKDWFGVVAFPAFATNLTTIYEKIVPTNT